MKLKIKSKRVKNKYILGEISEDKKSGTLMIFLSGFSGSRELPLFKEASAFFFKQGFSTLRFNFCNDSDEPYSKYLPENEDVSFSLYGSELKNVIDSFGKKYATIILVGHSFGAIASMVFLNKYKKYAKKISLVLWDPSMLPWSTKIMKSIFVFDKGTGLYNVTESTEKINNTFYRELNTTNSVSLFKSLKKSAYIIAAEKGVGTQAKKYRAGSNNHASSFVLVKRATHMFGNKKSREVLFKKTLAFLIEEK